jgi:hypothetical protein
LHLIGDVLNQKGPATTAGYAYFQTQHRRDVLSEHASKILALSSPHVRPPALSQRVRPETLLVNDEVTLTAQPTPTETGRRYYFRREELYELEWTVPVLEIATRLDVTDVAR